MGCSQSKPEKPDMNRKKLPTRESFKTPLGRSISREEYYSRHPKIHATNIEPLKKPCIAPSIQRAKSAEERSMLHVISVDTNLAENVCAHKTFMYKLVHPRDSPHNDAISDSGGAGESSNSGIPLVLRRGQAFDIVISTNRLYDMKDDNIRIVMECSDDPDESRGTRINLTLSEEDRFHLWAAKLLEITEHVINRQKNGTIHESLEQPDKKKKKKKKKDKHKEEEEEETPTETTYFEMKVRLFTPPTCIVAKWTLHVETIIKEKEKADDCCILSSADKVFRYPQSFTCYVIFNPWCSEDQVYIDDEICRNEYVLNDAGYIYKGTANNIETKPWQYGQFESFMLDCCFYLLDKSLLSYKLRGNPIHICRQISALTNSIDDGGVMVGDWTGQYGLGTSPMAWISSISILEEYWRSKQPVRYGQCWVFAGVVTTLCRALGIPSRPVTNYLSAHDTDGSITIDSHWNHKGEPLKKHNRDTIWNFHVWNDVWMRRPDLPAGFGGWQAIDATPQETSNGIFCTGPMSIEAIKNGLIHLPYDGHFVFAEVNADRVHWIHPEDGGYIRKIKETSIVGKNISTKAPMSDDRLDITNMYKYAEGCHLERTAVLRAAKETQRCDIYESPVEDMVLELVDKDRTLIGQPLDITFKVTNNSNKQRTVKLTLTAQVVHYTGVPGNTILTEVYTVEVPPLDGGTVVMTVRPEQYMRHLVDMCMIQMNSMALVLETNQIYCHHDCVTLEKPHITLKVDDYVVVGEEFSLEMQLTNPLNRPLTRCQYHIHGTGIKQPVRMRQPMIAPRTDSTLIMTLFASQIGTRKLIVSFDSRELSDISTEALLNVIPVPEVQQDGNGSTAEMAAQEI